jgi:hypothetical protein
MVIALLTSCEKTLTPQEFARYIDNPQNGFITQKKQNNYQFKLQYLPGSYVALQYILNGIESDFNTLKMQLDSNLQFKLTICNQDSVKEDKKSEQYLNKVNFLNNYFIENCYLITENNDSLRPIIHHFERGGSISPCENVMFAFNKDISNKPMKLIINASIYTKKNLEFDIRKVLSSKVPRVSL